MDWQPDSEATGTLVRLRGRSDGFGADAQAFARHGELLAQVPAVGHGFGAAASEATWLRFADQGQHVWDLAHDIARRGGMGFGANGIDAAEPDRLWSLARPPGLATDERLPKAQPAAAGEPIDAWHLARTGLDQARAAVSAAAQQGVLIAHLDTGFDPEHDQKPHHIDPGHRSLVRGEPRGQGAETPRDGNLPGVEQPGHGTATLAILAGPDYGGAPHATVLPLRVGRDVVIIRTGDVVAGFGEAVRREAQVLSMSMGGLASAALADVVNAAYEAGMVVVTAAGNTMYGKPFPSIVWPARFRRVIAACGIMKDDRAYEWPDAQPMAGCHGPIEKMATAVSAFTPDIPWAELGTRDGVSRAGGTSAATPQIAAAVALWLARWATELTPYHGWQRAEAARQALFTSIAGGATKPDLKFGWGVLDAMALLATPPMPIGQLQRKKEPPANASWGLLKLITGEGVGFADHGPESLFELELMQLLEQHRELADNEAGPELPAPEALSKDNASDRRAVRRVLERVEASPLASAALRRELRMRLAGGAGAASGGTSPPQPAKPPPSPPPAKSAPAPAGSPAKRWPPKRRLRIYARDPSLAASLATSDDVVATVEVRAERGLQPGPVGDYLEIIDVDPATDRVYDPVDLNSLDLALSDGLKPSEGNPAFHQQMVYAVAMRTIEVFEESLGRKMLWATGRTPGMTDAEREALPAYRQRLRIYPHAIRELNAFYSPARVAILFGYAPSTASTRDTVPAGTLVFSCLSADIIAHEVTHALLDGISPALRDASNPDVLAFHEGFADIVALFEQFRIKELVRRQLARRRGNLTGDAGPDVMAGQLGELAGQLGRGRGGGGALRDYAADRLRPPAERQFQYNTSKDAHDLGSVLVSAVYDAFLAIARRRTESLMRLATGGTGRLPEGELHPVLLDSLTEEVCKAASDVQRMMIRALDYLPPNDLTFGDFLRAAITADMDAWPEDRGGYRTALIEAFRGHDIYPRGLRTLSEETLSWNPPPPELAKFPWLTKLIKSFKLQPGRDWGRKQTALLAEKRRTDATAQMKAALASDAATPDRPLHKMLGLDPNLPAYVDSVRAKQRERGASELPLNRRLAFDVIMRIRQRRQLQIDPQNPDAGDFLFWGGATLIIDPFGLEVADDTPTTDRSGLKPAKDTPVIRYVVVKSMTSADRLARERAWRASGRSDGVQGAYGAARLGLAADEPFAMLHARTEEE